MTNKEKETTINEGEFLCMKNNFITLREVLSTNPQGQESLLRAINNAEFPSPIMILGWTQDMLKGHIEYPDDDEIEQLDDIENSDE